MMDKRRFLVSSAVTYVGSAASVLCMIAFYGASLRIGNDSFGALQAVMSLAFLLSAGHGVAGSFIVLHAVGKGEPLPDVVRRGMGMSVCMGIVVLLALVSSAPTMQEFLHLDTPMPFILIGLAAVPSFVSGMAEGVLNTQRRFAALAMTTTIIPASNLILSFVLFADGFQQTDAGWIILGSQSASLVSLAFIDWKTAFARSTARHSLPIAETVTLLAASLLFGCSLRFDVFWARHVLTEADAGSYAVAASIAIVLYLLSGSMTRVASASLRSGGDAKVVPWSFLMIIAVSAVLGLGFYAVGTPVLRLLAGRAITIDWWILLPLFASITCYSIITFDYSCLNILTKRVHVGIAIILVCSQMVTLVSFGTTARSIALTQFVVMAALTAIFSHALWNALSKRVPAPAPHPAEHHLTPTA